MHKIKKHWVVLSTMLLVALGGSALMAKTPVHASVNNNDNQKTNDSNPVNENMNSKLTNQNGSQLSQSSGSQAMNSSAAANSTSTNSVNGASGQSQSSIQNQAAHLHQHILLKTLNNSASPANDNMNNNVNHNRTLGASDNSDTSSKTCDIITQYVDPDTNHVFDTNDLEQPNKTPFKYSISDIKSNVPDGYSYGGIAPSSQNVTAFKPGFQFFNVIVHPIPVLSNQISLRYILPKQGGERTPQHNTAYLWSDKKGSTFNLSQWTRNLPQGYQLDTNPADYKSEDYAGFPYIEAPIVATRNPYTNKNGKKVIEYQPGLMTILVGVEPIPQTTQMTINYVDSADPSKPVKSVKTSAGDIGSAFDVTPYENAQNVPSDYQATGKPQNVPSTYESNAKPIVINVTREKTSMPIEYVDATDSSKLVKKMTQTKDVGLPFDIKPYEGGQYLSSDYQVTGVQNVPAKYTLNAKPIVIKVTRKNAKMTVNYVYVDNQGKAHSIKSLPISGNQGDAFDVTQYKKAPYLPAYYQSKDVVNDPVSWTNNRQMTVHVAPQSITMPITYQLSDGKQVGTQNAVGLYNTPFNSTEYGRLAIDGGFVPKGYAVVEHSTLPTTYQPKQAITYTVKQLDNMNVIYLDTDYPQKNKQARGLVSVTPEADGTPFNIQPYESQDNVPDGYHVLNVGNVPKTYVDGGQAFINVRPNVLTPDNSISAANSAAASAAKKSSASASSAPVNPTSASQNTSASASASNSASSLFNSIINSLNNRVAVNSASSAPSFTPTSTSPSSASNSSEVPIFHDDSIDNSSSNSNSAEDASNRNTLGVNKRTDDTSNSDYDSDPQSSVNGNSDADGSDPRGDNSEDYNGLNQDTTDPTSNQLGINSNDNSQGSSDNFRFNDSSDQDSDYSDQTDEKNSNVRTLPRTGEEASEQERMIAAALISLGGSIMNLGLCLRRRRHDDD